VGRTRLCASLFAAINCPPLGAFLARGAQTPSGASADEGSTRRDVPRATRCAAGSADKSNQSTIRQGTHPIRVDIVIDAGNLQDGEACGEGRVRMPRAQHQTPMLAATDAAPRAAGGRVPNGSRRARAPPVSEPGAHRAFRRCCSAYRLCAACMGAQTRRMLP
jgi:hypothetical protein